MKEIFIKILKQIKKLFYGFFLGVGIQLSISVGLSYIVENFYTRNFDQLTFEILLPLIIISFLGIYLVFWKKQYLMTIGMFLGILIPILVLGIILEVGMSL